MTWKRVVGHPDWWAIKMTGPTIKRYGLFRSVPKPGDLTELVAFVDLERHRQHGKYTAWQPGTGRGGFARRLGAAARLVDAIRLAEEAVGHERSHT